MYTLVRSSMSRGLNRFFHPEEHKRKPEPINVVVWKNVGDYMRNAIDKAKEQAKDSKS